MPIAYLPYKQIDKTKWDACVAKARNQLIYGFSYYLDNMATNWDGLVLNDYEAVMPLPWRKKFQIRYLYQPPFTQQGGIFSSARITGDITKAFIEASATQFKFAEIALNYGNEIIVENDIPIVLRKNNILLLHDYENILRNYGDSFKKSLKRVNKFNMLYQSSYDHASVIDLYENLYTKRQSSVKADDYLNFRKLCDLLAQSDKVITRLAYDKEKNLLAASVLLRDNTRMYNLISCVTDSGKRLEANYFLYDKLIQEFSGKGLSLDLEGSEVKGIAAFYKKFNPILESYPFIRYNNLHPLLKLVKH